MRYLSSPDWQAPLWVAATCLRMVAEQCDGGWPVAPDQMRLLMGFFAAAAAAIPDSEGHAALLDLALQVKPPTCQRLKPLAELAHLQMSVGISAARRGTPKRLQLS